ncbi:hypothetical protein Tco_1381030 [Tanacetum coccineum]
MIGLILEKYVENAHDESNLSISSIDINVELSKEFLVKLQKTHNRTHNEDVVDHIAMVLEMVDLIYILGMDSHQLQIKVFSLSLSDDAKEWWTNEGEGKITTWGELVEITDEESSDDEDEVAKDYEWYEALNGHWNKGYVDNSILINDEWKESKYEYPPNTATDSFFKAYDIRDIEEENRQGQIKCKNNDKDDKKPNKKVCKTKKFEAIKYSLGPNKEYIAVRRCECNTWERNDDSMSQIYQEIF